MTFKRGLNHLCSLVNALGAWGTAKYLFCHTCGLGGSEYWLRPRMAQNAVCIRRGTSDMDVFKLIFVDREYSDLDDLNDVGLVIDCGANVGYSSAYFLSAFPRCFVVAVEPDPGNYAALERNLAAYRDRAKLLRCGIWSHTARLALSRDVFRDGREWSRQVRVCEPGEPADIEGVDIGTLLAESGRVRISLLKMDIEGAEAVVFAENYSAWLERVDAMAIELHDDSMFGNGFQVFHAAIKDQNFQVLTNGELTICRRPAAHHRLT